MRKHTPTPYQYTPYPNLFGGHSCGVIECTEAVRRDGRVVAYVRSGPNMPDDEAEANGFNLAHAANCHAELVAALEKARRIVVDVRLYGATTKSARNALEEIDAALDKVKSGTADEVQQQDMDEETL